MPNCFELYGVDFLVDESLHVHLLEVNPGPDFKQTGQRLRRVIVELFEQTCALVVDTDILEGNIPVTDDFPVDKSSSRDFVKVYDKEWSAANIKGGMRLN